MAQYRVYYLQENRTESDVTTTSNPRIAALVFRNLVSRGDMRSKHPIAVLERDGLEIKSIPIAVHDAKSKIDLDPKEFPPASPRRVLHAIRYIGEWKDEEIIEALARHSYNISKSRLKALFSGDTALSWEELEAISDCLAGAVKN